MKLFQWIRLFVLSCLLPLLQSCGGGGGDGSVSVPGFAISVAVTGLTTDGLTLASGPEVIAISAGAVALSFQGQLTPGTPYSVSIRTQPTERDQVCAIVGSTGVVASIAPVVSVTCHATQWQVTTVAGSGQVGSLDGPPTTATFAQPSGVAVAADGTVYVADTGNNKIRKIAGAVSTLSGSGALAYTDGPGTSAAFNVPQGVAVDGAGSVFVADSTNCVIRMVRPDGSTSTLAGRSFGCFFTPPVDGASSTASFNNPEALALAPNGTLYVADTYNHAIRLVTQTGAVTSLWPFGSVFVMPQGVAADSAGNVYFPDSNGGKVYKVSSAGTLSVLAGSDTPGTQDGQGAAASFTSPRGIAVDSAGNVFIGDGNVTIRKITPSGRVTTIAGQSFASGSADGNGGAARFSVLASLAVDPAGNVYVADLLNNRIRKMSAL